MAKWIRALTKEEATEAIRDWLLKTKAADEDDVIVLLSSAFQVQVIEPDKPNA